MRPVRSAGSSQPEVVGKLERRGRLRADLEKIWKLWEQRFLGSGPAASRRPVVVSGVGGTEEMEGWLRGRQ